MAGVAHGDMWQDRAQFHARDCLLGLWQPRNVAHGDM